MSGATVAVIAALPVAGGSTPFSNVTIGANSSNTHVGLDMVMADLVDGSFLNDDNPAVLDFVGGLAADGQFGYFKMTDAAIAAFKASNTIALTTAKFRLRKVTNYGTDTLNVYNCLRDGVIAQLCGENYSNGNAWATFGGRGSGTDRSASTIGSQAISTALQYFEIDLDLTTMENIINGVTSNFGILVYGDAYSEYAGTTGTDGQRPEFLFSGTRS